MCCSDEYVTVPTFINPMMHEMAVLLRQDRVKKSRDNALKMYLFMIEEIEKNSNE